MSETVTRSVPTADRDKMGINIYKAADGTRHIATGLIYTETGGAVGIRVHDVPWSAVTSWTAADRTKLQQLLVAFVDEAIVAKGLTP